MEDYGKSKLEMFTFRSFVKIQDVLGLGENGKLSYHKKWSSSIIRMDCAVAFSALVASPHKFLLNFLSIRINGSDFWYRWSINFWIPYVLVKLAEALTCSKTE